MVTYVSGSTGLSAVPVSLATTLVAAAEFAARAEAAAASMEADVEAAIAGAVATVTGAGAAAVQDAETAAAAAAASAAEAEQIASAQPTRLELLGAAGDGITPDSAIYASALYDGKAVYATPGKTYLVEDPTNSLGIPIEGTGRIVSPVDGGLVQQNSKFDHTEVHFRAHLWKVKNRIIAGALLDVVVFGDSTATNGYGIAIDTLISDELHSMGLGIGSVISEAVAGHAWSSQNLATILTGYGVQKHLAIVKFGINDAGSGVALESARATLRNAMRQRLGEIRASTYGGYDDLSILLIYPNALGNTLTNANNRNNLWLEMVHQTYVEAAKDYQCALYSGAYVDARNAVGGGDRWLDAALVHPQANYNLDIWGRALREMLTPFGSVPRNRMVFRTYTDGAAPPASAGISQFPRGVSVLRGMSTDGYPYSGLLTTVWHPDNTGSQTLDGYTLDVPQRRSRNWITASSTWSAWSGDGLTLPLASGFTAYSGSVIPTARRAADGLVVLSGALKSTSITTAIANATEIATLPVGYRPAAQGYFQAVRVEGDTTKTFCSVYITAAGSIQAHRDCDGDYIGLDGIVFYAAS